MKNSVIRLKLPLIVVLLSIAFLGCKVTLVPPYEQDISAHIETVSKQVDSFYLNMLETTTNENDERAYSNFADDYVGVEVELNSLLLKNRIRPLNENSTRICEITIQLWSKYKEEHKADNELSDGLIKLNQVYMRDLFYAMQVAEEGKNIINNQNQ